MKGFKLCANVLTSENTRKETERRIMQAGMCKNTENKKLRVGTQCGKQETSLKYLGLLRLTLP